MLVKYYKRMILSFHTCKYVCMSSPTSRYQYCFSFALHENTLWSCGLKPFSKHKFTCRKNCEQKTRNSYKLSEFIRNLQPTAEAATIWNFKVHFLQHTSLSYRQMPQVDSALLFKFLFLNIFFRLVKCFCRQAFCHSLAFPAALLKQQISRQQKSSLIFL